MIKHMISGFAKDLGWTKKQVDAFIADGTVPVEEVVKLILFFEFEKLPPIKKKQRDSRKGTRNRFENNLKQFKALIKSLGIIYNSQSTAKSVLRDILAKDPNAVTPDIKTIRSYLREIKKGVRP